MNSYSSLLQQGHGQDTLSDTVWLMTFFESASLIGSQVLANWLLGSNPEKGIASSYSAATFMAMIGIMFVSKGWKETTKNAAIKDYRVSYTHIFNGKCLYFVMKLPGFNSSKQINCVETF